MATRDENPMLAPVVRWLLLVAVGVVAAGGLTLLLAPQVIQPRWLWTLTPFNARFLAAIYLAEMVGGILLVVFNRWAPARIALPMSVVFTAGVSAVSLVEFGRFDPQRPATWLWFFLYLGYTALLVAAMWRFRGLAPAQAAPTPPAWRAYLLGQGTVMGLYGLALLLLPTAASAFWPWPIDSINGRVYSTVFIGSAVGAWLMSRVAAPVEWLTMGAVQSTLGLLAIVGLVLVDLALHRVNWSAPGTWLWVGAFAVLMLAGLGMLWQASRQPATAARAVTAAD
jgi:hypothetical protein